jgi:hypothetical protein
MKVLKIIFITIGCVPLAAILNCIKIIFKWDINIIPLQLFFLAIQISGVIALIIILMVIFIKEE